MHTAIFSYVFVPLSTLFLARGTDFFATNFSSISISRSRQAEFLLWCLLTGGYFYISLKQILRGAGRAFQVRMEAGILNACAWTAGLFVLLPYLPARFPLLSALHVLSALAAPRPSNPDRLLLLERPDRDRHHQHGHGNLPGDCRLRPDTAFFHPVFRKAAGLNCIHHSRHTRPCA